MKKYLTILLFSLLITTFIISSFAIQGIMVIINNKEIDFEKEQMPTPYISESNRTMVPIRLISEKLNYTVNWIRETREVVIKTDIDEIILEIDSNYAQINKRKVPLDVQNNEVMNTKAIIVNDRTFVPLRFVVEYLGANIEFISGRNTEKDKIIIQKNVKEENKENIKEDFNTQKPFIDEFGDINPNMLWIEEEKKNKLIVNPGEFLYPRNKSALIPPLNNKSSGNISKDFNIINEWLSLSLLKFKYSDDKKSLIFNHYGIRSEKSNSVIITERKEENNLEKSYIEIQISSWPNELTCAKEDLFIKDVSKEILEFYLERDAEKIYIWINDMNKFIQNKKWKEAQTHWDGYTNKTMKMNGKNVYITGTHYELKIKISN